MGFENGFLMTFIGNCIATIMMIWLIGVFVKGFTGMEEYEPISIDPDKVDDQDMYAIATGNEEYLAAHCTLNTRDDIEEKDELQELRRQVEIAKLRKELVELKARQVHAPNSKNKPKDQSDVNPILQDCTDALIALGVPKRKAKAEANNILENSNIKTVQDFITEYGKR